MGTRTVKVLMRKKREPRRAQDFTEGASLSPFSDASESRRRPAGLEENEAPPDRSGVNKVYGGDGRSPGDERL